MLRPAVCSVLSFLIMYGAVNSEASGSSSSNFVLVGKNLQQCKLITNNPCALHFKTFNNTWNASVPNSRGLYLDRAVKEFSDFKVLLQLNNYCSHMLYTSLCFYYFPQCSLKRPRISATTCKEVCLETMEACLPVFHALQGQEASIPPHVDCTLLESQEEHINALASLTETDPFNSSHIIHPLVCPNASIHLDFSPPAGKMSFEVKEGAGNLEVCLVLANTGSYDTSATLTTPVTVSLSTYVLEANSTSYAPATPNTDYIPMSAMLTFPVGSIKWSTQCANVSIINNNDENFDRSLGLRASVISPSAAKFGGEAQSSTGTIEAIIVDDDDIHVKFKLPAGKSVYEVFEDEKSVEVCLMLVGDKSQFLSSTINVTLETNTTPSTFHVKADHFDYTPMLTSVTFEVNSTVGDTKCVNVSITHDGIFEVTESFTVSASMANAAGSRFAQPVGNVEVIIQDDDINRCTYVSSHCKSSCSMRRNAVSGTYKQNCYGFAARVEVLRHRILFSCQALDVILIECWELEPGTCPPNGTRISVPLCNSCNVNVSVGGEYLISGIHKPNVGMFVHNSKKRGLLGRWKEREYSSIGNWIQAAIDLNTDTNNNCN